MRRLFHLELPLRQDWEAIEPLRDGVTACLRAVFRDLSVSESLAMVAGELLENAVKFGDRAARAGQGFGLSVQGDERGVEIEVSSPAAPSSPEVERLLAEIARIGHAPSPREAYLDAMRRVALRGGGSGLGLARIAHEGGCDLSATVGTDGVLRVRAVTRSLKGPSPTPAAPA